MIRRALVPAPGAPRTVAMRAEHDLCPGSGASLLHDGYRLVGLAADLPPFGGRQATIGDRTIALFAFADEFVAVEIDCAHDHLHPFDGIVLGGRVGCPIHGWIVDPRTGLPSARGEAVRVHDVRERDGLLYVRLRLPIAELPAAE